MIHKIFFVLSIATSSKNYLSSCVPIVAGLFYQKEREMEYLNMCIINDYIFGFVYVVQRSDAFQARPRIAGVVRPYSGDVVDHHSPAGHAAFRVRPYEICKIEKYQR